MGKGQAGRKIGSGMKPRGNQRVKPQTESKTMTEQSTTEGQATPTLEAVLDHQQGNETPCDLEPENGEDLLQNLENAQSAVPPIVAQDGDRLPAS